MPMMYYLYLLECADGTLYTGITTDLNRRLKEHNGSRGAKYTRTRQPVQLRYSQAHKNRSEAQQAEAKLKKRTRAHKLKLIQAQM